MAKIEKKGLAPKSLTGAPELAVIHLPLGGLTTGQNRRVLARFKAFSGASAGARQALPLAPPQAPLLAPPAQALSTLGQPLDIRRAAQLIGVSPWTVRQKLIPMGLPFFRSAASGKMIFYSHQLVLWIQKHQGGTQQK